MGFRYSLRMKRVLRDIDLKRAKDIGNLLKPKHKCWKVKSRFRDQLEWDLGPVSGNSRKTLGNVER